MSRVPEVRMFTPLGLDHVVLHVRDQAASERFYRDVLGCTLERVNEKFALIQLRFGEHLIDLVPARDGISSEDVRRTLDHFCLSIRCPSLEKVAGELRERGVVFDGGIVNRYGAYGDGPSLYIRDPDGYVIELKPRS